MTIDELLNQGSGGVLRARLIALAALLNSASDRVTRRLNAVREADPGWVPDADAIHAVELTVRRELCEFGSRDLADLVARLLPAPPVTTEIVESTGWEEALQSLSLGPADRTRVANALAGIGVRTLAELRRRTVREVSRAKNLGPKSLAALIRAGLVVPACPSDGYDHRRVEHEDLWGTLLVVVGRPHCARLHRVLVAAGITDPGQLWAQSPDDLRAIDGLGEKSVEMLRATGLLVP